MYFLAKRGITPTGRTSTRKRGITSTLCWEPFPRFKNFFWVRPCLEGSSVPDKLIPPPPTTSRGLGGGLKPKQTPFSQFFFTKFDLEPKLGGLQGRAGSQKLGDNRAYHPEQTRAQNTPPFRSYLLSMLFPFSFSAIFPF